MHQDGRLKWLVLALCSIAIAGNYYAFDSVAPVAGLLRTQRGLTMSDFGLLNSMIGLPNIPLSLLGGLLIDRFGASRTAVAMAGFCFVGTVLTALGGAFGVMVFGRLLFGIGQETLLAGIAQWFHAARAALAMSLLFSLARVGSYMADISPDWASGIYAGGWQPPLWLAAGLSGISLVGAVAYWLLDMRRRPEAAGGSQSWQGMFDFAGFDRSFWYILTLNVLFGFGVFSVPQHLCDRLFPGCQGVVAGRGGSGE